MCTPNAQVWTPNRIHIWLIWHKDHKDHKLSTFHRIIPWTLQFSQLQPQPAEFFGYVYGLPTPSYYSAAFRPTGPQQTIICGWRKPHNFYHLAKQNIPATVEEMNSTAEEMNLVQVSQQSGGNGLDPWNRTRQRSQWWKFDHLLTLSFWRKIPGHFEQRIARPFWLKIFGHRATGPSCHRPLGLGFTPKVYAVWRCGKPASKRMGSLTAGTRGAVTNNGPMDQRLRMKVKLSCIQEKILCIMSKNGQQPFRTKGIQRV